MNEYTIGKCKICDNYKALKNEKCFKCDQNDIHKFDIFKDIFNKPINQKE